MTAVILDATPLGLLCHPRNPPHAAACRRWLADLLVAGRRVIVPEVADYEVRRELIRTRSQRGLIHLDQLHVRLEYLPLTTLAMRLAAELWARARIAGVPTAGPGALDGDAILAGQAVALNVSVIIATENPAHLARYAPAELWSNITP